MKRVLAIALFLLFLTGCPALIPVIQGAMNAAQWVGSILDVADQSQRRWFSVNPDVAKQAEIEQALFRAKRALSAMNGIAVAAKSADDGDMVRTKRELVAAYKEVEALFLALNVPIHPGMKPMEPPRMVESGRVEAALTPSP